METQMIYFNLEAGIEQAPLHRSVYISNSSGPSTEQPSPDMQAERMVGSSQGIEGQVPSNPSHSRIVSAAELEWPMAMAASWVWAGGRAWLAVAFTLSWSAVSFWTGSRKGKRCLSFPTLQYEHVHLFGHVRAAGKCSSALGILLSRQGAALVPYLDGSQWRWCLRPGPKLVSHYLNNSCFGALFAVHGNRNKKRHWRLTSAFSVNPSSSLMFTDFLFPAAPDILFSSVDESQQNYCNERSIDSELACGM